MSIINDLGLTVAQVNITSLDSYSRNTGFLGNCLNVDLKLDLRTFLVTRVLTLITWLLFSLVLFASSPIDSDLTTYGGSNYIVKLTKGADVFQFSTFGSILNVGCMIGAITSGRIADYSGRKRVSSSIFSTVAIAGGFQSKSFNR